MMFLNARSGINRIRLEFKVSRVAAAMCVPPVLIESDWNLKEERKISPYMEPESSINRIRLEFKAN